MPAKTGTQYMANLRDNPGRGVDAACTGTPRGVRLLIAVFSIPPMPISDAGLISV